MPKFCQVMYLYDEGHQLQNHYPGQYRNNKSPLFTDKNW